MKVNSLVFFLLFLGGLNFTYAQDTDKAVPNEAVADHYQDDITFMVQSFQTILNLLGDPDVSRQDKDEIINASYLKFFENNKVQIEDDLDPNRVLPINKNVQSYLQDVVFFYKNITFTFDVSEISKGLNDNDKVFYKVSLEERLEGVNLYGEPLKEVNIRYIELNLDEKAQEFKIVSVYTTKLSEMEDMATWWNELDMSWRTYFATSLFIDDSTSIDSLLVLAPDLKINDTVYQGETDTLYFNTPQLFKSIKSVLAWEKIVIQPSDSITQLKPLSKFSKLEVVDFSDCSVDDVSPLRSLLSLRSINASGSLVSSLSDLKFLSGLQKVWIDNTGINELNVSSSWTDLQELSMQKSQIIDLSFLSELSTLTKLNLKGNRSVDYSVLGNLPNLITLDISATSFQDIRSINTLTKLHSVYLNETSLSSFEGISDSLNVEIIAIDNTKISDLSPLNGLASLKMIYCDSSLVKIENVKTFINENPGVLVIYETKSLQTWWTNLDENLKNFIRSRIDSISEPPQTETLHQIIFTESVNLSGQKSITSLEGFQQLINLKKLDISGTEISDLSPLSGITQLNELTLSKTPVVDLGPIGHNANLITLDIQYTKVSSLDSIVALQHLELIKADSSGISQEEALAFMRANSSLLLYQSSFLIQWWETLADDWVHFFSKKMDFNKNPSAQDLQELVNTDSLEISNLKGISYDPLKEFKLLHYLNLDRMETSNLKPLLSLQDLHSLHIHNGGIGDLTSIGSMSQLTELDLSTTSISELDFMINLSNITSLNLSGTAIESIKPLSGFNKLEYLDLSNTRVKKINYLIKITSLKELKLTNTALNPKKIDSFKRSRPDVEVIIY
jgi:hypothetical protein